MVMLRIRFIVLLILSLSIPSVYAGGTESHPITPYIAEYQVTRNTSEIGKATIKLEKEEANYTLHYHSKVSRFFLTDERTEKTRYVLDEQDAKHIPLSPIHYQYERTGTGPDDKLVIDFINLSITDDGDTSSFAPNALKDNQFFRLDIPYKLANNIPVPEQYSFYNYRGEERSYIISDTGIRKLSLPIGKVNARYFVITRPNSSRRVTHAWFAPEYDYQLVRMTQFKDDKEQADIRLKTFTTD